MTLKTGEWKMNQNGLEGPLTITTVDQATGLFEGSLAGASFTGIWDETSRTITFLVQVQSGQPQLYKGFLFSTPRNRDARARGGVQRVVSYLRLPEPWLILWLVRPRNPRRFVWHLVESTH